MRGQRAGHIKVSSVSTWWSPASAGPVPKPLKYGYRCKQCTRLDMKVSSASCALALPLIKFCEPRILPQCDKVCFSQVDKAVALDKKLSSAGLALAPLLSSNLVDIMWSPYVR